MLAIKEKSSAASQRGERFKDILPVDKLTSVTTSVVGVGAIGRQVAIQLVSMGVTNVHIIDFDTVDPVNLGTQGWMVKDLKKAKVEALEEMLLEINPEAKITAVNERYAIDLEMGNVIFSCVDSMQIRKLIWENHGKDAAFLCDGRMSAEVIRTLVADKADIKTQEHYSKSLFDDTRAFGTSCTAKSTIYCAYIAAGLMVNHFSQWIRGMPTEKDNLFNLLALEYRVGDFNDKEDQE